MNDRIQEYTIDVDYDKLNYILIKEWKMSPSERPIFTKEKKLELLNIVIIKLIDDLNNFETSFKDIILRIKGELNAETYKFYGDDSFEKRYYEKMDKLIDYMNLAEVLK